VGWLVHFRGEGVVAIEAQIPNLKMISFDAFWNLQPAVGAGMDVAGDRTEQQQQPAAGPGAGCLSPARRGRGRGLVRARRGSGRGRAAGGEVAGGGEAAGADAGGDEVAGGEVGVDKRKWLQREWKLLKYARSEKKRKSSQLKASVLDPLVHAWNDERLRYGDEVEKPTVKASTIAKHPNAFRPCAVLVRAWRGIGASSQREGVDGSHAGLDFVTGVAGAMAFAQRRAATKALDSLTTPCVIMRHYDFTPAKVRFGALQAELMPHARYWQHDGAKWKAVGFEEISRRFGRNLRYGTVELFAECSEVHYASASGEGIVSHRFFTPPPVVGQRANACVTFEALEKSIPQLDVESVNALSERLGFLFYLEAPDASAVNGLKKKFIASVLGDRVVRAITGQAILDACGGREGGW